MAFQLLYCLSAQTTIEPILILVLLPGLTAFEMNSKINPYVSQTFLHFTQNRATPELLSSWLISLDILISLLVNSLENIMNILDPIKFFPELFYHYIYIYLRKTLIFILYIFKSSVDVSFFTSNC